MVPNKLDSISHYNKTEQHGFIFNGPTWVAPVPIGSGMPPHWPIRKSSAVWAMVILLAPCKKYTPMNVINSCYRTNRMVMVSLRDDQK